MIRQLNTLILMIAVLLIGACMQKDAVIPKEGDVVTWMQNSSLIIRAELGQRREHIADSKKDPLIYEPEYEMFVGQFPIDYVPEPFPKLTEEERVAFEAEYANKLHGIKDMHYIEFSLMLNGVKGKVTDDSPYGDYGLDNSNQVKVIINGYGSVSYSSYNAHQLFELELMKELDASTQVSKDGLVCYNFIGGRASKRCFGTSENESVSRFNIYVPADIESSIHGESSAFNYGGATINWYTNQKNLYQAKEIDAAIWRLLEVWNVSPIQQNH